MRMSVLVVAVLTAACQTYEFVPAQPHVLVHETARSITVNVRSLRPDVFLALDTSASMLTPLEAQAQECPTGCGPGAPCPPGCRTRMSEASEGLRSFLADYGAQARYGGVAFPAGAGCEAPAAASVDLLPAATPDTNAELAAQAQLVAAALTQRAPAGGTPTAAALDLVRRLHTARAPSPRPTFAVLVTDGLPNCNGANPAQVCACDATRCGDCAAGVCAAQRQACRCTGPSCDGALCSLGCLDDDASVAAVAALRAAGVQTAVIGFGAEAVGPEAAQVLARLAVAGGVTVPCDAAAPCATGACVKGVCETPLLLASDGEGLARALLRVNEAFLCQFCPWVQLDVRPVRPELVAVLVNDVPVPPGRETWTWDSALNAVSVEGELCRVMSTMEGPVALEVRVLGEL